MKFARFIMLIVSIALLVPATHSPAHAQEFELKHDHAEQQQAVEYVCPMHSHIVSDEPGTCPICGMDLEPQQRAEQVSVVVSDQMQQNLGIQTTAVTYDTLWRYYPTIGTVQWNTNEQHHLHSRAAGWVEKLYVRSEGESVQQGDKIYEIYSRELVVAQQDFLQALNGSTNPRLLRDARLRLELLGFAPSLVKQLEQTQEIFYRVPVFAAHSGVVTQLNIAEGMYVEPGLAMMTLIGTDSFWLIADVPERYSDWLRVGSPADITLPQANLNAYETEIEYIYPELDAKTRTQRVRIKLPNSELSNGLLVGMQAAVELYGGPKREALVVPLSSLIITGSDNRIIVRNSEGGFEQRAVHVGLVVGDKAEILHGVEAGEQVVVAGQFLLDSEATLQSNRLNRQQQGKPEVQDAHAHH
ncbi:efflux RND transporter periplasmic adaptor subunit [Pseudidiomarina donghaiensis]|uniref:Efflux RND transporter periplasmic adaptor subunit n=1 Tax=Pseudidiomarina donghaiensis TaxID=519452 RepID=A0A432XKF4_9GAMM|nr:efflux RND transporter periplasmic adaptor subunit [Pseudidiomarina donghaiensis]RUO49203.1 efflux RND transporter periplasmic adaptor subunit [Pseudidiomarina donghaiensis]SFV20748.1 membrane fusion protein, Cu(I)/Ag(I) efflux system [Pseudidiomarina donghaiensis]